MKSIWQMNINTQVPGFPVLRGKKKTGVLIIGGGAFGILTAFFLHQKGVPYILVEKNRICGGTTANTTAKITFQHGLICNKILKQAGLESAKMYLYANKRAFDRYSELCGNIECDYEIKDNFVYSNDRRSLEDEMNALQKIGYPAVLAEDISVPVANMGAVCFRDQAQFNPLDFFFTAAKDLNIYENTFVREMIGNTAVTDEAEIQAEKVVAATHFPFINKHGSYFIKLYQHRSYMIAVENAEDVNGMYVSDSNKGITLRNYRNYLLIGGGGIRTGKKSCNWEEARNFAAKNYPGAEEKCHWAAQDCMSLDSIPYIGRYSKSTSDLYTASGFNKWGMTGAMLAAMIISDEITGVKNEFAKIFDPSRSILKPQLFVNGFESIKNLLTISKKRCPHVGCSLKWNAAEHSWDCPCHGSRFAENGEVLDNPANGDLKDR